MNIYLAIKYYLGTILVYKTLLRATELLEFTWPDFFLNLRTWFICLIFYVVKSKFSFYIDNK